MHAYVAKTAGLSLLLLSLSACSLAPQYGRPDLSMPPTITRTTFQNESDASSSVSFNAQSMGWRDFFKDEQLKELIAESLAHNQDVKLAVLAIREAGYLYNVQNADRFPQLTAKGENNYSGGFNKSTERSYDASIAVPAFELDFFGRLKNASESSLQKYLATEEAEKTAKITLVSLVAQGYLAERLAREQLQLTENNLESWRRSYAFIEKRMRSGQSSLLELEQARGQVEFVAASIAQRQREVILAANALRPLLGRFEERVFSAGTSLTTQSFAELPEDVSSAVLLERPDVMGAEHALRAAYADIGAARAAFFPSISLTGKLGYASENLETLFSGAASMWSFLPQITIPVFSAGKNRANLDLASIRKEISVAQYEKTIQNAFREAADFLMARASFASQLEAQKKYLASQQLVLHLATTRYASGAVSYLEVLDAQRKAFQAEQDLLNMRRDQLVNDVRLYSALGGGLVESTADAAPAVAAETPASSTSL